MGAGKLLGLTREKILGRPVGEFAHPAFKPQISELWKALQEQGEQAGTLHLAGPDATPRDVEYTAKVNVLPVRNILVLRDKNSPAMARDATYSIPSWVQDTHSTCWIPRAGWPHGTRELFAFTATKPKRL